MIGLHVLLAWSTLLGQFADPDPPLLQEPDSIEIHWNEQGANDTATAPGITAIDAHVFADFTAPAANAWIVPMARARTFHPKRALTIHALVRFTTKPPSKCALVSRWPLVDGQRAFELGLLPNGRPFLSISASGSWDERAAELHATRALVEDRTYLITGTYDAETGMHLFVNGRPSGFLAAAPPGIQDAFQPLWIAGRPPRGDMTFRGFVGTVLLVAAAETGAQILERANAWRCTQDPGSERFTFEQAWLRAGEPRARPEPISQGPHHHWFGYYDKQQVDATGRYVLMQEVEFEHRSPRPDDTVGIGTLDLANPGPFREVARTHAWNWQQGCMLQWRPKHARQFLWNDREDGRFVTRIHDLDTGTTRTIPHPIYHVHPEGRLALTTAFERIQNLRPGYGYAGVADTHADEPAPPEHGIALLDLETGERTMLVTLPQLVAIPYEKARLADEIHYANHVQWNPSGTRFLFLHRWRSKHFRGFETRLFTAARDGSDLRMVSDRPGLSHFEWWDDDTIHIHRGNYVLLHDRPHAPERIVFEAPNGHQSAVPGTPWILTDTYPRGNPPEQWLYLFHRETGEILPLARFAAPTPYRGEWRCDLHPRLGPRGEWAYVDAPNGDAGRQVWRVDLRGLLR